MNLMRTRLYGDVLYVQFMLAIDSKAIDDLNIEALAMERKSSFELKKNYI